MIEQSKDPDPHQHLTDFVNEVKPLAEGGRIIEAIGHWADDNSFITPAFIIETREARISQMSCLTLARDLRQSFENKGFDAFHANVTGELNG